MIIKGPQDLVKQVQTTGKCCSCGACLDLCPYFKYHAGKPVLVFDCDLDTGRCHAYCPKLEVDYSELSQKLFQKPYPGNRLGFYQEIKAAKAGRMLPEQGYQAGGTVSALVAFGIEHGFFEAAVLTDSQNGRPQPRIVTSVDEVLACATSKFTTAPTLSALNRAIHKGYKKIGVVGTPCQITAVAQMKYNQLENELIRDCQIITVGLFCNWALSPRDFFSFLEERYDMTTLTAMDIPPPPSDCLILKIRAEDVEIPLKEIRPYIDQSCFNCMDLTAEWADMSVGMFEGRPGWNTLIIRSITGSQLIRDACESGYLVAEDMPEDPILHLKKASQNKKQRALRVAIKQNELNTPMDKAAARFRMPQEIVDRLLQ